METAGRHCARHIECTCEAGCGAEFEDYKQAMNEFSLYRDEMKEPAPAHVADRLSLLEKWMKDHEHAVKRGS